MIGASVSEDRVICKAGDETMLKRLQNWDRKLESFINEMDRTLQEPINRATTFEVFRQNDAHRAHPADQQDIAEIEIDANGLLEATAPAPSAPASPKVATSELAWDYYPTQEGGMCRG
jgi:hypothetical protein